MDYGEYPGAVTGDEVVKNFIHQWVLWVYLCAYVVWVIVDRYGSGRAWFECDVYFIGGGCGDYQRGKLWYVCWSGDLGYCVRLDSLSFVHWGHSVRE